MNKPRARTITLVWIAVFAYILSACAGNEPNIPTVLQESFANMIPIKDMNKSLTVTILSGNKDEVKSGSAMDIAVENISSNSIYFQNNPSTIKLYAAQNGEWVEIKNNVTYLNYQGEEGFVLSPKNSAANLWTTLVVPSLAISQDTGERQEDLRILIVGEVVLNGQKTGNPVGAYVDTLIVP
jgi:hypothetical protein